jgi:hypothetical protein
MKTTLAVIAQFLLFLFVDAIGGIFYHPFQIQTALPGTALAQHSFAWDGVILTALVYALVLLTEALRKRLRRSAPWSTIAFAFSLLAGCLLKLGFVTHNW